MSVVGTAEGLDEDVTAPRGLPALAARPLLVVLLLKCGLAFAVAGRYGWQRDELYYAVAGRHLQGGYVEFPPVTALLSATARVLFGWSLVGFRAFAILAGAATILLAALVARELGGGRKAQTLAAALVAFSPIMLATNGLFQPVSFDQTATMLVLWLALRLALGRGSWLALGVAVGVGLETKYTLALVLVLLVAGFALWRRDVLASRGLILAVAVAGVLMVPNLVWEAGHGWISVHWFLHPPGSATDESRPQYLIDFLLQTNPFAVPVAVAGVVTLLRDRAEADRGRRGHCPGRVLRSRRQVVLRDAGRVLRARGRSGAGRALADAPPVRCIRSRLCGRLRRRAAAGAARVSAADRDPARRRQGTKRLSGRARLARARRAGRAAGAGLERRRREQLRRSGSARALRAPPAAGRVHRRDLPLLAPGGHGTPRNPRRIRPWRRLGFLPRLHPLGSIQMPTRTRNAGYPSPPAR